jgi:hypothetical protein
LSESSISVKSPKIHIHNEDDEDEGQVHIVTYASATHSPCATVKNDLEKAVEDVFMWQKDEIFADIIKSNDKVKEEEKGVISVGVVQGVKKVKGTSNFKEISEIMKMEEIRKLQQNNNELQTDIQKRISTNLLTYTEKANGVISERKRGNINLQCNSSLSTR